MRFVSIDRNSDAYKRITTAGFKIGQPITRSTNTTASVTSYDTSPVFTEELIITIPFTCTCGRVEYLRVSSDYIYNGIIDVASTLETIGAVSEDHLRKDGYSEDEIKYIRRAY